MAEDMSSRLRDSLLRRREATSPATPPRSDDATDAATDVATQPATDETADEATSSATSEATDVAAHIATRGALQRRTQEATVRRAYTVYARQDRLLADLARELDTDKSDVLRQIIDAWLAAQ